MPSVHMPYAVVFKEHVFNKRSIHMHRCGRDYLKSIVPLSHINIHIHYIYPIFGNVLTAFLFLKYLFEL